jgi:hypothetical protein
MRRLCALIPIAILLAALGAEQSQAAPTMSYGIQDDNWILNGPGRLGQRLDKLDRLGVDMVRFTLRWNVIEARQGRYNWGRSDQVLRGLRTRAIVPVVTLVGVPGWANGGKGPAVAPARGLEFSMFASEAAKRYPFVRHWLIWNEPNLPRWLQPTNPGTYVRRLLNPAYAAIKKANRRARVAGGVTGPRGNAGGMSPVDWLRGMRRAGAKLDAYAHHPHPGGRTETPSSGGCWGASCKTITLANLPLLQRSVKRAWGSRVRIWLTEWGYQTNPPDRFFGVPFRLQAEYIGEAARRVYRARGVDMLIQFLYQDEPQTDRFQSGLFTSRGHAKPSLYAFSFPLTTANRVGDRVNLWGQIRPRNGPQPFRLQRIVGRSKVWLTPVRFTDRRGTFEVPVAVPPGAVVRVYSVRDRRFGPPITVRPLT